MTPAINAARQAQIAFTIHDYAPDAGAAAYGLEAAAALQVDPARVFKTLVVQLPQGRPPWAVGLVPVSAQLDLKSMAAVLGVKKLTLANQEAAERATGYVVGGISPLGQKRRLPMVLDASAIDHGSIYVSAGQRGLELELAPTDLMALCQAKVAPIQR